MSSEWRRAGALGLRREGTHFTGRQEAAVCGLGGRPTEQIKCVSAENLILERSPSPDSSVG